MRCPRCGIGLFPVKYRGLRIETCHSCQGVWIDREWLNLVTDGRSHTAALQPLLQYLLLGAPQAAVSGDEIGHADES